MNNTPTTNARWERLCCSGQSWYQIAEEMKLDCRQLERELTAAREELVETRKDFMCLAELLDGHDATECRMNLVRLKEQRDRLAEALRKIQKVGLVAVDAFDELDRIDEIVDEALAAVKGGSDDFDQFRPFDF
jgi:chromosome segregation ATPase